MLLAALDGLSSESSRAGSCPTRGWTATRPETCPAVLITPTGS